MSILKAQVRSGGDEVVVKSEWYSKNKKIVHNENILVKIYNSKNIVMLFWLEVRIDMLTTESLNNTTHDIWGWYGSSWLCISLSIKQLCGITL